MPTKNPRLTITITPELSAQLRRVSQLTGQSQAGLISELLEGSGSVFDRLIVVLEAAEEARWNLQGHVTGDMKQAQQRIEGQLGLALADAGEDVEAVLLGRMESINRRGRKARGAERAGPSGGQGLTPPF